MDRKVLAALMTLHYTYKHYHNHEVLNELLFSEDTRINLAKKLELSDSQFHKSIVSLEEKGLIVDKKLNETLTKYPKDGNFKIAVQFKLKD